MAAANPCKRHDSAMEGTCHGNAKHCQSPHMQKTHTAFGQSTQFVVTLHYTQTERGSINTRVATGGEGGGGSPEQANSENLN
jgi:hypothetical protein